jgi:hypothetical protein
MPQFITEALIAGILASFACAAAGGLMFAASVYNLILPGLTLSSASIQIRDAIPVILGILLGALFLSQTDHYLSPERLEQAKMFAYPKLGYWLSNQFPIDNNSQSFVSKLTITFGSEIYVSEAQNIQRVLMVYIFAIIVTSMLCTIGGMQSKDCLHLS